MPAPISTKSAASGNMLSPSVVEPSISNASPSPVCMKPIQSKFVRRSSLKSGMNSVASTMPMMPTGTLIQKIHGHPA